MQACEFPDPQDCSTLFVRLSEGKAVNRDLFGFDNCGFASVARMAALLGELGDEKFLEALDDTPVVVASPTTGRFRVGTADPAGMTHVLEDDETTRGTLGEITQPVVGREVAVLIKRPGTPFPGMVMVGRALACDILLLLPTISKIHAFFHKQGPNWVVVDQRSMNGTFLNSEQIAAGEKLTLQDGDRIRFGTGYRFQFLLPKSFLDLLRKVKPGEAEEGRKPDAWADPGDTYDPGDTLRIPPPPRE